MISGVNDAKFTLHCGSVDSHDAPRLKSVARLHLPGGFSIRAPDSAPRIWICRDPIATQRHGMQRLLAHGHADERVCNLGYLGLF